MGNAKKASSAIQLPLFPSLTLCSAQFAGKTFGKVRISNAIQ